MSVKFEVVDPLLPPKLWATFAKAVYQTAFRRVVRAPTTEGIRVSPCFPGSRQSFRLAPVFVLDEATFIYSSNEKVWMRKIFSIQQW